MIELNLPLIFFFLYLQPLHHVTDSNQGSGVVTACTEKSVGAKWPHSIPKSFVHSLLPSTVYTLSQTKGTDGPAVVSVCTSAHLVSSRLDLLFYQFLGSEQVFGPQSESKSDPFHL